MDAEGARAIVDGNSYMTLATADAGGAPWASPVWFAHDHYETFLWMSRPGARHSRNIAARRDIAIVIFDSTVSPHQRNAVYVEAAAAMVPDAELTDAVAVYAARSVARGWRRWHAKKSAATRRGVSTAPAHRRCTYSRTSTIAASQCGSRTDHDDASEVSLTRDGQHAQYRRFGSQSDGVLRPDHRNRRSVTVQASPSVATRLRRS